eukprot:scaffold315_cov101-Isochrysis_galbana.AAC.1
MSRMVEVREGRASMGGKARADRWKASDAAGSAPTVATSRSKSRVAAVAPATATSAEGIFGCSLGRVSIAAAVPAANAAAPRLQPAGHRQPERLGQLAGEDHQADARREARDDAPRHELGHFPATRHPSEQLQAAGRARDDRERRDAVRVHRLADEQDDRVGWAGDGQGRPAHHGSDQAGGRRAHQTHLWWQSTGHRDGQRQWHRNATDGQAGCDVREHGGGAEHFAPLWNQRWQAEVQDHTSILRLDILDCRRTRGRREHTRAAAGS